MAGQALLQPDLAQPVGVGAVAASHHQQQVHHFAQFPYRRLAMLRRVADIRDVRPLEVAEPRPERADHATRIVDAERRLGHIGDGRVVRQVELRHVLYSGDEMNRGTGLPHGSFHLGMARMADQDQRPAALHVALALEVDLRNQRARRIQHRKAARFRLVDDRLGDAMGAEDRHGAVGNLIQGIDEDGPHPLEPLDDMTIVHDLVADIDRSAEFFE